MVNGTLEVVSGVRHLIAKRLHDLTPLLRNRMCEAGISGEKNNDAAD